MGDGQGATLDTNDAGRHDRFPTLDGYRAIAAVSVLVYHTVVSSSLLRGTPPSRWNAPLGSFGVTVFFLISGFLLYRPYAVAHRTGRREPDALRFWARRAARILPGYWLALIGLFVVFRQEPAGGVADWFGWATLTQIYRHGDAVLGLHVAWTLCIEVSFYLVLPLLAAAIGAASRRLPAAHRLTVELGAIVVLGAVGVGYRLLVLDHPPSWAEGWIEPRFWLPFWMDWFALGMLLAVLHTWWPDDGPEPIAWLARRSWAPVALAAAGYGVLVAMAPPRVLGGAPTGNDQSMARLSIQGFVAFLLLVPAVFRGRDADPWRRFLRLGPMVFLGTVSYGTYLWQTIVVAEVAEAARGDGSFPTSTIVQLVAVLAVSVAIATLSYRLVERPALDWARTRMRTGPRRPPRARSIEACPPPSAPHPKTPTTPTSGSSGTTTTPPGTTEPAGPSTTSRPG